MIDEDHARVDRVRSAMASKEHIGEFRHVSVSDHGCVVRIFVGVLATNIEESDRAMAANGIIYIYMRYKFS